MRASSPLKRLVAFGRPYAGRFALGSLLLLGTNALGLTIPWLLRGAIDGMERGVDLDAVMFAALSIAGVALAQAVARTVSRWTILGAARRVAYDVRRAFFAQLQRLSASVYDRWRTGDVMSRAVNDTQQIQAFFGPGMLNLLNTAIVYTAVLVLLFRLDVTLTLISLALYPVMLLVVNRISKRIYARSKEVQEQLAEISNRAQENLSGIQQVKTYVQEEREIEAFAALSSEFRRRSLRLTVIRSAMISGIGFATGVATLVVLFVGGSHVIEGRITFGDFVAFNAYLAMLTWPTIALGWIINVFQRGLGAMERVDALLRESPDVPSPTDGALEDDGRRVAGPIEIRGLSFAYDGADGEEPVPALHDVTLRIPEGSRVAIVGPVGSGKSTLVNLLARQYPVPDGTIEIGGEDINRIPIARLRRSLGYVPQEPFLFSRSIRDNIALRTAEASDEEVARVVELASLSDELGAFPKGLDTVVGERGFTLSGGQRQRATLARAILGDPPILILDDSLSSVDADTERAILDRFLDQTGGRTSILITHRFSTLRGMDRIVVLADGRIVEQGSHDELLAAEGTYARLYHRQQLEARLDAS